MNKEDRLIQAVPTYLERLGLGLAVLAAGCVAIAGAVELIGFNWFSDEKISSRAAAWVQAIGAPLAVGGAFWAAWYQAKKAHGTALTILQEQSREQTAARIRTAGREVRSAHSALVIAAQILDTNIRQAKANTRAEVSPERVTHLKSVIEQLRFFEAPNHESDADVVTVSVVAELEDLASRMAESSREPYPVFQLIRNYFRAASVVMDGALQLESQLAAIDAESRAHDEKAVASVLNPVNEWGFAYGWNHEFSRWGITGKAYRGPTAQSLADAELRKRNAQ